jgi:hypothetical protein
MTDTPLQKMAPASTTASLYDEALIIQGFVVSGVWNNLPACTLDEVLLFDQQPVFRMLNCSALLQSD